MTDTTLQWQLAQQSQRFFFSIWEYVFATNSTNYDEYLIKVELDLRKFTPFTGPARHSMRARMWYGGAFFGMFGGCRKGRPAHFIREAQERPIYTALNTRQVDAGNPVFGEISVVFDSAYAKNATFFSIVDSGAWEGVCNGTVPPESYWPGPLDCSQPVAPGTYGALHHVLLASELLWKPANGVLSPIVSMLQRLYSELPPPTSTGSQIQYLEPDIAAAVLLPHGIKAVIGVFSMVFGSPSGKLLQQ